MKEEDDVRVGEEDEEEKGPTMFTIPYNSFSHAYRRRLVSLNTPRCTKCISDFHWCPDVSIHVGLLSSLCLCFTVVPTSVQIAGRNV